MLCAEEGFLIGQWAQIAVEGGGLTNRKKAGGAGDFVTD